MCILVTGGAGFIGSHVAEAFLAKDHEVVVVDNLQSGFVNNLPPRATFINADICDAALMRAIFHDFRPEVVSHHAAQIDVMASLQDPAGDARTNIEGGLNVWQAAHDCGSRRFIFASSGGALYGDSRQLPTPEDIEARPISPYGMAKLAFERYLLLLYSLGGPIPVILRYSNVYGPRQGRVGEAGVISAFAKQLANGEDCTIYGDGSMTRDYVFVRDVAQANCAALTDSVSGVFNIGTGTQTSTLELLDRMCRLVGNPAPKLQHAPERLGEVRFSCLDTSLAKQVLGWEAQTSLEVGLREVLLSAGCRDAIGV
ncbi:UDP-glucose 4-epimerase [Abditibacteriota bacterium]|nr:UDP-glucose 4-epimerase [Abditibacteriota bacterium]